MGGAGAGTQRRASGDIASRIGGSAQGRNGPAFLAYPNFEVFFEWNKSFVYVMTAAYFATRLEGAPVYDAGNPDPGLDRDQMLELQRRLVAPRS